MRSEVNRPHRKVYHYYLDIFVILHVVFVDQFNIYDRNVGQHEISETTSYPRNYIIYIYTPNTLKDSSFKFKLETIEIHLTITVTEYEY